MGINKETQKAIDKDIEENPELYEALADTPDEDDEMSEFTCVCDETDVLRYETIEEILENAEEAAKYAEELGKWGEYDGIMSLVDEIRNEMYD